MARIAAKTLSRVEVDGNASNQHEFHAGTLRTLLGFEEKEVRGSLTFIYYTRDGLPPETDTDRYTLIDVRRNVPGRSEFHLYYYSRRFQQVAQPGDLLVMLRSDENTADLYGIVARPGTQVEKDLRAALALGPQEVINRFLEPEPRAPTRDSAEQLILDIVPASDIVRSHPLYLHSVRSGTLPTTAAMAAAAHELVEQQYGNSLNPDSFLFLSMEAETDLFYAIEQRIGEDEFQEILRSGPTFLEVLKFAVRKLQARRARRGLSLQNHVQALFDRHGIPYTPQCATENGATPDFVIPSCTAYHDPAYPSDLLRMVGCKSRLRERWSQYLREASRIHPKYHVSVDESLSEDLIIRMHESGLRLFMPRAIRDQKYSGLEAGALIGTIEDLIEDLNSIPAR